METWRKYLDLSIIAALLCGLFTYQHGGEILANIGPRFVQVKNIVSARFSGFETSFPAVAADEAEAADAISAPNEPGSVLASPANRGASISQGGNRFSQPPVIGQAPGRHFEPFCHQSYGRYYAR